MPTFINIKMIIDKYKKYGYDGMVELFEKDLEFGDNYSHKIYEIFKSYSKKTVINGMEKIKKKYFKK